MGGCILNFIGVTFLIREANMGDAVNHKKMVLCIADISGYTEFIKHHKAEITYTESLVQRLLVTIMNSKIAPFVVNKLEGDALLMYCDSINFDDPKAVKSLIDKSELVHQAFEKEKDYVCHSGICRCNPCEALPKLKVKVLFTIGDISILKMGNFTELSGVDVILLHHFLKNDLQSHEYTLLTEPLYNLVKGELDNKKPTVITNVDDVLGKNKGYVYPFSSVAEKVA